MPVLDLLSRRSRRRGSELFGDCSDDDLMTWGRELSDDDDDPFFADQPVRTVDAAASGSRPALADTVAR